MRNKLMATLICLPLITNATELSGEFRASLERESKTAPYTLSTDKTRITIAHSEVLPNGMTITGGAHIAAASTTTSSVFIRADSIYGTMRAGGEQGVDKIWGSGATVRFTNPGIGIFGTSTKAVTYISPEMYGVAIGASGIQTTNADNETTSGKAYGARYHNGRFNAYAIQHSDDVGVDKAQVLVYQGDNFRLAADNIRRSSGHNSNTSSIMYNNIYIENRRDRYADSSNNTSETAIGYRYEFSKKTSAIIETTKDKVYLAFSMRF